MSKPTHPAKRAHAAGTPRARHRHVTNPDGAPVPTPDERRAMIAEAAYYRAEQRGFAPGLEIEDWLAAERDIEHLLPLPGAPLFS